MLNQVGGAYDAHYDAHNAAYEVASRASSETSSAVWASRPSGLPAAPGLGNLPHAPAVPALPLLVGSGGLSSLARSELSALLAAGTEGISPAQSSASRASRGAPLAPSSTAEMASPPVDPSASWASSSSNVSALREKHERMLRNVMLALHQLKEQGDGSVPTELWRQVAVMLVSQLSLKRKRASREETLSNKTLCVLMSVMPKALPEFVWVWGPISQPDTQEALLKRPQLRQALDERVFSLGFFDDADAPIDEMMVLARVFLALLESAVALEASAEPHAGLLASLSAGAGAALGHAVPNGLEAMLLQAGAV